MLLAATAGALPISIPELVNWAREHQKADTRTPFYEFKDGFGTNTPDYGEYGGHGECATL